MKRVPPFFKGNKEEGPNEPDPKKKKSYTSSAPRNSRGTSSSSMLQDSSINKNSIAVDVTSRRITSGSNGIAVSINTPSIPSHNHVISLNRPPPFYFHPEENALREMLLQNRLDQLRSAVSLQTTIPCFLTPNSRSEAAASRQALTQYYVNSSTFGGDKI
jgi:hypothetical protein